ncbi:MAG: PilZ domain-containing protein [Candidatus Sulfotelmatobacter sp.]
MQSASFTERQQRAHYRHELRTLTYVTLDEANGGIIRNLNCEGVAVQAVGALRQQQRVRLRFELRFPRVRVETYGQVTWASSSGQCGIRFVDLPVRTSLQIDQWIFSNLLDAIVRDAAHPHSIFGASIVSIARDENLREKNGQDQEENGGLTLSAQPRPAIRLEPCFATQNEPHSPHHREDESEDVVTYPFQHLMDHDPREHDSSEYDPSVQQNWLSRPLSGRTLAWMVDTLVVIAALLLFALIFLSIAHELPQWPIALGAVSVAAVFVAAAYRAVFFLFGETTLGARLARTAYILEDDEEAEVVGRFR